MQHLGLSCKKNKRPTKDKARGCPWSELVALLDILKGDQRQHLRTGFTRTPQTTGNMVLASSPPCINALPRHTPCMTRGGGPERMTGTRGNIKHIAWIATLHFRFIFKPFTLKAVAVAGKKTAGWRSRRRSLNLKNNSEHGMLGQRPATHLDWSETAQTVPQLKPSGTLTKNRPTLDNQRQKVNFFWVDHSSVEEPCQQDRAQGRTIQHPTKVGSPKRQMVCSRLCKHWQSKRETAAKIRHHLSSCAK